MAENEVLKNDIKVLRNEHATLDLLVTDLKLKIVTKDDALTLVREYFEEHDMLTSVLGLAVRIALEEAGLV